MYSKKIMDYFLNPEHAGGMRGADIVGKFESEDAVDIVKLYIKLDEENGTITQAQFKAFGSPATIACCEVACEMMIGKTIEEAEVISNADIISVLGELPMEKISSATSVENAVQNAFNGYKLAIEKANKKRNKKK